MEWGQQIQTRIKMGGKRNPAVSPTNHITGHELLQTGKAEKTQEIVHRQKRKQIIHDYEKPCTPCAPHLFLSY